MSCVFLLSSCGGGTVAPPEAVSPYKLYLSPNEITLDVGANQQLVAFSADKSGNLTLLKGASITWTAPSPSVATVNSTGMVSGLAAGSETLQGAVGTTVAQTSLNVQKMAASPITAVNAEQTVVLDNMAQWKATGITNDGSISDLTTQGIWTSSNTSTISIDPITGKAILLKTSGQAYITFQYGTLASTKTVTLGL